MKYLEIKGITQKYQKEYILKDLDLNADKGELLVILGESGCGKTTLLKIIAGLIKPEKGKIFLNNVDITDFPPQQRNVGYVPQASVLFPHMTVKENIIFGLKAKKANKTLIKERLEWITELAQVEEFLERLPSQLSGGQKQRVALARAMAINPQLLLLDEPLSAIDATARESLALTIRRIQKETETTTLYVTHNQEEARLISDKVAVMYDGKIQQLGEISEIDQNPKNFRVAKLVGSRNVIPVDGYSIKDDVIILETVLGTIKKKLNTPLTKEITGIKISDEAITITNGNNEVINNSSKLVLKGKIKAIMDYGAKFALVVIEVKKEKIIQYLKLLVEKNNSLKQLKKETTIGLEIKPEYINLI